ncbi:hypothetical protein [Enterococcus phage PEF1]
MKLRKLKKLESIQSRNTLKHGKRAFCSLSFYLKVNCQKNVLF